MLSKFGLFSILFAGIVISFLFVNLGLFFDVTKKPKKTDVIVCLGGGGIERVTKSLELYLKGYSKSGKIILTGSTSLYKKENKITFLVRHGIPREKIIFLKKTYNTMNEVLALKNFLLKNNMKSAMFISDPPHSRRIMLLVNTIAKYKRSGLSCIIVSSGVQWWDKEHYYNSNKAIRFVTLELFKLPYNYLAYAVLTPLGIYDPIKKYAGELLHSVKIWIQSILS